MVSTTLTLSGLTPSKAYIAHYHAFGPDSSTDPCASNGPVTLGFPGFTADGSGNASVTVTGEMAKIAGDQGAHRRALRQRPQRRADLCAGQDDQGLSATEGGPQISMSVALLMDQPRGRWLSRLETQIRPSALHFVHTTPTSGRDCGGRGSGGTGCRRRGGRRGQTVLLLDQEGEQSLGGQAFWSLGGLFLVDSPEQRRLGIRDSLRAGPERLAADRPL